MDEEKKDDGRNNGSSSSCSESQNNSQMVCLSEDTIFDILTRLPANFLMSSARYTRKSWANMISKSDFAETHLLRAKPGIFLQSFENLHDVRLLEIKDNGEFEVTYFRPHFSGQFSSSCCGIMLLSQNTSGGGLLVANPVTMKAVSVKAPHLPGNLAWTICIVRVPCTGEFKLFASDWNSGLFKQKSQSDTYREFFVLRLGKDYSWKKITEELGVIEHVTYPIYVGGNDLYWITKHTVILMDVDTETCRQFPMPQEIDQRDSRFLKMGNCLCCIIGYFDRGLQIHTFNSKLGRWTLYHRTKSFDYPTDGNEVFSESVEVWINQELIINIILKLTSTNKITLLFAYNVETRTLRKIHSLEGASYVNLHTNTLLSWKSSLP